MPRSRWQIDDGGGLRRIGLEVVAHVVGTTEDAIGRAGNGVGECHFGDGGAGQIASIDDDDLSAMRLDLRVVRQLARANAGAVDDKVARLPPAKR